jgi:hypothetical protein
MVILLCKTLDPMAEKGNREIEIREIEIWGKKKRKEKNRKEEREEGKEGK